MIKNSGFVTTEQKFSNYIQFGIESVFCNSISFISWPGNRRMISDLFKSQCQSKLRGGQICFLCNKIPYLVYQVSDLSTSLISDAKQNAFCLKCFKANFLTGHSRNKQTESVPSNCETDHFKTVFKKNQINFVHGHSLIYYSNVVECILKPNE